MKDYSTEDRRKLIREAIMLKKATKESTENVIKYFLPGFIFGFIAGVLIVFLFV